MKLIYIIFSLILLNGTFAKQNDAAKESQTCDVSDENTTGDITDLADITDNSVNSNYLNRDIDQQLVGLYNSSQDSIFENYNFQSYRSSAESVNILDFLPKYTENQFESRVLIGETNSRLVKKPFHKSPYEEKNKIFDSLNSNFWSCTDSQCQKISLADVQSFFKLNPPNLSNKTVLNNFMARYADFNISCNASFICMNLEDDSQYPAGTPSEHHRAMVDAFQNMAIAEEEQASEIDTMEEGHEFKAPETGQEVEPEFYELVSAGHNEEYDLIVGPTTVPFRFANRLHHFTRAYLSFTGRLDNMVSLMDSDQEIHTIQHTHNVNRANELYHVITGVINYGRQLRSHSREVPHNIIDEYVRFGVILKMLLGHFHGVFFNFFLNVNIGDDTPRINFLNLVDRLKNLSQKVELIKNEVSTVHP